MGNLVKNGISYTGGSGASSYNELNDKPSINGTALSGNKTSSDLGIATEITELDDVAITTPSDNDVLKYNSTSGKWENGQGGGGAVSELTDVELDSLQNGQVLKWNSTDEVWENADESGGGGGHTIEDVDGTDLTQRDTLQFGEGLLAEDDSTNEKTVVALDPMPSEDIDEVVDIYPQAGNLVSIVNAFNRGDIYSTDEKMIGQWVDGKPLYQKVLDVSSYALTNKGITTIQSGITVIDKLISIEGLLWHESGGFWRGMPQVQDNSTTQNSTPFQFYKSTGEITVSTRNNEGASAFSLTYIILQYTKTTDTAISIGSENEYSTNEKVVGTWINGKPIYQLSVPISWTGTTSRTYTNILDMTSYNVDEYLGCRGFFINNVSGDIKSKAIPYADQTNKLNVVYDRSTKYLQILTYEVNGWKIEGYATIQYTKTSN